MPNPVPNPTARPGPPTANPPAKPEAPDVTKARGRARSSVVWGAVALGFGLLGLVLALFFSYFFVSGWGLVGGAVAIPFGLKARKRLEAAGLHREARQGTIGAALGAAGVVVIAASLAVGVPKLFGEHTVILDHEAHAVGAGEGLAQSFHLTGGTWTVDYRVAGGAADSFTSCIVPDAGVQDWIDHVSPTQPPTGQACSGPASTGAGTARLDPGTYALVVYCWNAARACQLTLDLSGDP